MGGTEGSIIINLQKKIGYTCSNKVNTVRCVNLMIKFRKHKREEDYKSSSCTIQSTPFKDTETGH